MSSYESFVVLQWFLNGFWQGQMQASHVQKDQIEHDITHLSFCLPKASLKKIGIYCNQHVKISGIKYKKYVFQYGGYYRVISKRKFLIYERMENDFKSSFEKQKECITIFNSSNRRFKWLKRLLKRQLWGNLFYVVDFLVLRNGLTPGVVRRASEDEIGVVRRDGEIPAKAGVLVVILSAGNLTGGEADLVRRMGEVE